MLASFTEVQASLNSPGPTVVPPRPPKEHRISPLWWFLYVVLYIIGCMIFAFIIQKYGNIFWYPLVFGPSIVAYFFYRRWQERNNSSITLFSDLFRAFSQSFFGAGLLALIVELVISIIAILIVVKMFDLDSTLASNLESNTDFKQYRSKPAIHFFIIFNAYFIAGVIEESCKGFILQYVMKLYLPHTQHLTRFSIALSSHIYTITNVFVFHNRRYLTTIAMMGFCVGIGFGTMEGVVYVCVYGASQTFLAQFFIWAIRAFIAIPFHSITGFMWGVMLARRECNKEHLNWFMLAIQQILFHGTYNFIEMEFALWSITSDDAEQIGMVFVGIFIAILLAILTAGYSWFYMYRKAINFSSELIPDEYSI